MDAFFQWLSSNTTFSVFIIVTISILVIGVVLIYVTAFIQGRAIQFWPPSIAEKPSTISAQNKKKQLGDKNEEKSASISNSASYLGIIELYNGRQETSIQEIHARVRAGKWAFFADDWFGAIRFDAARRVISDFVKEGKSVKIIIAQASPYKDKIKAFIKDLDQHSRHNIEVRIIDIVPKGIYGTDLGAYVTFHCEHIVPSESFTVYCVPTEVNNNLYAQALGEFEYLWKKGIKL